MTLPRGVEGETSIQAQLSQLTVKETALGNLVQSLVDDLSEAGIKNWAKILQKLGQVRERINNLEEQVPSSGPSSMMSEATHRQTKGPEPDRFRK